MYLNTAIVPDPGQTPRAYLGGTDDDIPVIEVVNKDGVSVQVQFGDDADALAYCEHMATATALLADQLRRRVEGADRLLAAVYAEEVQP